MLICCGGLTDNAAICVISAFWLFLNRVNTAATSGDIVDPPIVLPTGGTVVVANVCCVLVVLVSSSLCVVLKMAYGFGFVYPCCPDVGFVLIALRRQANASWKKVFILAQIFGLDRPPIIEVFYRKDVCLS